MASAKRLENQIHEFLVLSPDCEADEWNLLSWDEKQYKDNAQKHNHTNKVIFLAQTTNLYSKMLPHKNTASSKIIGASIAALEEHEVFSKFGINFYCWMNKAAILIDKYLSEEEYRYLLKFNLKLLECSKNKGLMPPIDFFDSRDIPIAYIPPKMIIDLLLFYKAFDIPSRNSYLREQWKFATLYFSNTQLNGFLEIGQ